MLVYNKRDFVKRKIVTETILVVVGAIFLLMGLSALSIGIMYTDQPTLAVFILVLGAILFIFGGVLLMNRIGEIAIWRAGLAGQKIVPQTLKPLSNEYVLLNNISLKGRNCDIDHIVVGKAGIYTIESKHYNGEIYGQGDEWSYLKRGRAGGFYRGHIGNPARQIKRSTWELKEAIDEGLNDKAEGLWIEPIVVFTHPNTSLRITDPPISVILASDLNEYIEKQDKEKNAVPDKLRIKLIEFFKSQ
jgi:hypothetical protein